MKGLSNQADILLLKKNKKYKLKDVSQTFLSKHFSILIESI